jgi:hypothetical protein
MVLGSAYPRHDVTPTFNVKHMSSANVTPATHRTPSTSAQRGGGPHTPSGASSFNAPSTPSSLNLSANKQPPMMMSSRGGPVAKSPMHMHGGAHAHGDVALMGDRNDHRHNMPYDQQQAAHVYVTAGYRISGGSTAWNSVHVCVKL